MANLQWIQRGNTIGYYRPKNFDGITVLSWRQMRRRPKRGVVLSPGYTIQIGEVEIRNGGSEVVFVR